MDIDYTTPRTALHSLKEELMNTRIGRPFARKRDQKAAAKLMTSRLNGELPEGMANVIDAVENFNKIKF